MFSHLEDIIRLVNADIHISANVGKNYQQFNFNIKHVQARYVCHIPEWMNIILIKKKIIFD